MIWIGGGASHRFIEQKKKEDPNWKPPVFRMRGCCGESVCACCMLHASVDRQREGRRSRMICTYVCCICPGPTNALPPDFRNLAQIEAEYKVRERQRQRQRQRVKLGWMS